MKSFAASLMAELEQQLLHIKAENNCIIKQSELGVKSTVKTIEKLKTFFSNYRFENKTQEIEFFKTIKPQFAAKLIFFNEVYNIEITKPCDSKKEIKKHYAAYKQKLKRFHEENIEFYKYYKSGNRSLDKKYFLRGKHDIKLTLDSFYFQSDYSFATSHDYKVAQIMAYEQIQYYLNTMTKSLKQTIPANHKLKWSASKTALVELIYALDTVGVFNEGKSSLRETAIAIQSFFNIELGQFNRIYLEIRNRKTIEKTHFLDHLKQSLLERINRVDEK
ncbi:RteC domain-containing protein [Flavobacterium sedimenticola]|uniref:RteC domain-containing protein n=1 Tax=Flavobacterium sedimenticola TaxID=3043286 RepID=A0ABT6XS61_9FLAO|nr:RteC domain-containing protein [Flavobacterium sedimenticola]MDI9257938.1 RteC domain-containing protein [Flavobacterium sedimenticola]